MKKMLVLVAVLFLFAACGDDPIVNTQGDSGQLPDEDVADTADSDTTADEDIDDTSDTTADEDVADTADSDTNCNTAALNQTCQTDDDCGACMICTAGGRCIKGCTKNEDCRVTGTECNTKLARCVNTTASAHACSETNCPKGCCYAEKGLSGLKCLTTPNPGTCGLCAQGEIYSPEDSKCITAACSATTDNCPSLNSSSSNPPAKCYACQSDLICKPSTKTSGCSAGTVINAAQCVPAGQQCVEGVSECCSGMPCVQGYCY